MLLLYSGKLQRAWGSSNLDKEYHILPRDAIHASTALIEGAEIIISQDVDFEKIKGLKRKWMI